MSRHTYTEHDIHALIHKCAHTHATCLKSSSGSSTLAYLFRQILKLYFIHFTVYDHLKNLMAWFFFEVLIMEDFQHTKKVENQCNDPLSITASIIVTLLQVLSIKVF